MSSSQRESLISLASSLIVSLPYFIYVFSDFNSQDLSGVEVFKFWTSAILWLIPLRIVVEIVFHILTAIIQTIVTQTEPKNINDERDTIIGLKSLRNGYYTFILAFIVSIIVVHSTEKLEYMFMIMILGGFLAELVELFSKMIYYKRG